MESQFLNSNPAQVWARQDALYCFMVLACLLGLIYIPASLTREIQLHREPVGVALLEAL